jgi:hypothetical protein
LPEKRKPPSRKRNREEVEKVLGPKPSPQELLKLYVAGPDARRGAKLFDSNNQRRCEKPTTHDPEKMFGPEDFEIYPSKNTGWYFQGTCHGCRLEAARVQRKDKAGEVQFAGLAERLRQNPHTTATVKRFSRDDQMEAMKMARDIRSGKLSEAFMPPGTFGAVTDVKDMQVHVQAFLIT